jgi:hypothetical protein
MKWYKRLKVFKASNVSYNPETKEAYSYGWWKFVTKVNGKVVFNRHHYSSSTCKHQSKVMREMNYDYDLEVNTRLGLQAHNWQLDALSWEYVLLFKYLVKQENPRRRIDFSNAIEGLLNRIELVKKVLKVKLTKEEIEAIKNRAIENELDRVNELEYKKACKELDAKAPNVHLTHSWSIPEYLRGQIISKDNFKTLVERQVLRSSTKFEHTYDKATKASFNLDYTKKFESEVLNDNT